MSADRQPLLSGCRSRHGQKNKKTDLTSPFGPANLMLAEHNRTGPALAANPATFPLNDVVFRLPDDPDWTCQAAKPVFPDKPKRPAAALPQG